MKITNVRFRKVFNTQPLKAILSVTLEESIAIHDIKLVEASGKMIVVMPSRRKHDGTFTDIVHPINSETRDMFDKKIIEAYNNMVSDL